MPQLKRAFTVMTSVAVVVLLVTGTPTWAAEPTPVGIPAADETAPVGHGGDTADDPAIWVNQADPARSLVIGNDKKGALETYDLSGARVQRISDSVRFWGNVDVRGDLVATYHNKRIRLFRVDPLTRLLSVANEASGSAATSGEGVCMWDDGYGGTYAFTVVRATGRVRQYRLADADLDGLYTTTLVRDFTVGSESEGCVADDRTGALYVSEEDVALWRYSAAPMGGSSRVAVDTVTSRSDGRIAADIEGVTVAGERLIVSAQHGADGRGHLSYFLVYDRTTNRYLDAFRVEDGATADDCDLTDGVTAYAGDLGPLWPTGLFVCQDNNNQSPAAYQNFKLVPWSAIP